MATFFLVRHAAHDLLSHTLAGRMPGVPLSSAGRMQAEKLAQRLERDGVSAVRCGPLERAWQTAEPIGRHLGLPVTIEPALNEIDFGAWNGRRFDELRDDSLWHRWNLFRSGTRTPGGESMPEVQARMVGLIERLRVEQADARCVLVGHGDAIKAALAHYLGVALDLFQRIEIGPASISMLEVGDYGPRILSLNETLPE